MVQYEKAQRIRKTWEKAGKPECSHALVEKEYYLGQDTGDEICMTCGSVVN